MLALEDIEDAFPLIRRIGLWATYEELGTGEQYLAYRKCRYGDEGGGASPMKNIMVVQGKVIVGGGMDDGTFQGSVHATKDLLVAGDMVIRRTRYELERSSIKSAISICADDLALWDPNGVDAVIALHQGAGGGRGDTGNKNE